MAICSGHALCHGTHRAHETTSSAADGSSGGRAPVDPAGQVAAERAASQPASQKRWFSWRLPSA